MALRRLLLVAAAILFAGARITLAVEETSLLAPDGTLYVVRAGTGADLGIADVAPDDNVIAWSSLRQDGTGGRGLVPGAAGITFKHNLDLAFDEPTGALIVLWTEEVPLVNLLRLGILRADQWTVTDLLPTNGFPHARNPRMLLSHPVVHTLDADGKDIWATRSVLSVVYWEESNVSQARYSPMFLDEDSTASQVQVYDLPATIGGGGPTPDSDIPAGAYLYPSLQLEGPGGGILASFADLNAGKHYVVRISFPTDLGKPGPTNLTWLRRRIPVVGLISQGPLPRTVPRDAGVEMATYIGPGYNSTLVWHDETAVRYVRFDGKKWSDVSSIALGENMSYDRALRLVRDMATKN
jgi:hypothetical protein